MRNGILFCSFLLFWTIYMSKSGCNILMWLLKWLFTPISSFILLPAPCTLKKKDISTSFKRPVLIQRFYSVIVQLSSICCLWGWVNRGEIAELPLQLRYAAAAATKALSRRRYLSNCRRHITGFLAAQAAAATPALCIISSAPNRGG